MKLLLVDDEPGIREGLAALLRKRGHEVVTAGDCARAAALLSGGDFDLVVTDWHLPDGRAEQFLAGSTCPAVAMSGHPDDIAHPSLCEVLTKPVSLSVLLQVVTRQASRLVEAVPAGPAGHLPRDVAALVAAARRVLGDHAEVADDGTFVVLRAPHLGDQVLPELAELGGDLRILAPGGRPLVELRWCRDGRPDPCVPVVTPGGSWPDAAEFAVDFDGAELAPEAFGRCLDRATERRSRGDCVHFLNVPDVLLSWASGQGRADDMPMRTLVGPRLPAVLADLWS